MKGHKSGKIKITMIILVVLVVLGVIGGILVKEVFYKKVGQGTISNQEANRLIRYLSLNDYQYSERLGSSFTVSLARDLLKSAGVPEDKISVSLKGKPGFCPITKKQFETIYDELIDLLDLERLSSRNLYIFEIDSANDEEIDGVVYELISTNEGNYYMEKDYGMDHSYVGKVVKVYLSNNEIIMCLGESQESVTIPNAYATKITNEEEGKALHIYAGGVMRTLQIAKDADVQEKMDACLCDVDITNQGVTKVQDLSGKLEEK